MLRPTAAMGAVLVGASAVLAAPGIGAGATALTAHTVAADVSLTALGWQDVDFLTPDGWAMFDSAAAAQLYADEMTATTLSLGATALQWAGWLDPVLSFVGISGIEDWVSDRYDLFAEILSPGWEPLSWFESYFSAISADPEVLFGPVADFNLGWAYGLLGISAEDGAELDGLLELASGYYGGVLTWGLMGAYAVVPGAINAVVDGLITLDDLFPDPGSELDLISSLAGESMLEWISSTEETLTGSMDNVIAILEGAPGVQWILDLVSQFTAGVGTDVPF
jgi:hypothetical protein